ncbi:hypothetical protein [Neobacillus sp. CF12]|nr:hypothetical protein [Neobacillus sp. CF12]MDM5329754.1 hypothetical protein [Neobacillus sp. CF12]
MKMDRGTALGISLELGLKAKTMTWAWHSPDFLVVWHVKLEFGT